MPKDNIIPEKYRCSITGQIMMEPVFTSDGHTYEREKIDEWLQTHNTSPKTGVNLENKNLTVNHDKRSDISDFLENNPELYDGDEVYLPKAWVEKCVMVIKQNQLQVVHQWLNKDRRLLTLKLEGNYTALHLACEFSSPELVEMLLNILKQKNNFIFTLDGIRLNPKHLNVLLEKALNLNRNDYVECELLLSLGAEVEQPESDTQNTLLHRMVIKDNKDNLEESIKWLLERKAALESRNIEGNTSLMLSVIQGNIRLTELLLKMKADIKTKNNQQQTALHIAASRGDVKMLEYLLQNTEVALALIDVQNAKGDTPLHLAVQFGQDNVISLLLEAGAYHKIKNEQGKTPIDLSIEQKKPNFIVQTVRRLKKDKLKETDRLHQVFVEQVSEIATLKTALQNQEQGFKTQIFYIQQTMEQERIKNEKLIADMQAHIKLLQPAVQEPNQSSPTALTFSPQASPCSVRIHASLSVPYVNPNDIAEFLTFVAEGEQGKAKAMLKSNRDLALVSGNVIDLSNRIFNGITGFQYAVWALDWHMWTMIKQYLPNEAAREQAQGFEKGFWVKQHGVHANLNNLIQAYQKTIHLYNAKKYTDGNTAWVQEVGGEQRLLPAHVVNEYCHPIRPFYPVPNFKDADVALPRTRTIETGEDWFYDENLGKQFGVYRSAQPVSRVRKKVGGTLGWRWGEESAELRDHQSIIALASTRIDQREELITELRTGLRCISLISTAEISKMINSSVNILSKPTETSKTTINISYQYEDNDIQAIVSARLQQLRIQNSQLFIKPIEILAAIDNIMSVQLENRLRQEARNHHGERICLIPCNLGNAHWVGMLLEFSADGKVLRAEYIDSFTTRPIIPEIFQVQLQKIYPKVYFKTRVLSQQSDYTSCGAYTIENLLTAALGIQSYEAAEIIRSLHLEALRQYNPNFHNAFNERQRNNRPSTATLHEQLGYLYESNPIRFSTQELNRIFSIKQHLFILPEKIQIGLLEAFKHNSAYNDDHALHLNTIRTALQEAAQVDSKALKELMQLLFENWQAEDSATLDKMKFRVSYNEILAVTKRNLAQNEVSKLQKSLAEQIQKDEQLARELQAEWNCDETFSLGNNVSSIETVEARQNSDEPPVNSPVVVHLANHNSFEQNNPLILTQFNQSDPSTPEALSNQERQPLNQGTRYGH
ncbi:MAG TPA: ankyrin repeat domain-containing protein [Gammaproteobacteria bacterium]|nr:ankyrin repeat domain-containing protein [Gammaproteobacteria bacterium]HQZ87428.1 ankyrin repeat domain-containing protein [Gammaproteobacteria bacterium]HRA42586.1 ankyrin repeat domain-containing protein [Gammaproteobacteria bacterium]